MKSIFIHFFFVLLMLNKINWLSGTVLHRPFAHQCSVLLSLTGFFFFFFFFLFSGNVLGGHMSCEAVEAVAKYLKGVFGVTG